MCGFIKYTKRGITSACATREENRIDYVIERLRSGCIDVRRTECVGKIRTWVYIDIVTYNSTTRLLYRHMICNFLVSCQIAIK